MQGVADEFQQEASQEEAALDVLSRADALERHRSTYESAHPSLSRDGKVIVTSKGYYQMVELEQGWQVLIHSTQKDIFDDEGRPDPAKFRVVEARAGADAAPWILDAIDQDIATLKTVHEAVDSLYHVGHHVYQSAIGSYRIVDHGDEKQPEERYQLLYYPPIKYDPKEFTNLDGDKVFETMSENNGAVDLGSFSSEEAAGAEMSHHAREKKDNFINLGYTQDILKAVFNPQKLIPNLKTAFQMQRRKAEGFLKDSKPVKVLSFAFASALQGIGAILGDVFADFFKKSGEQLKKASENEVKDHVKQKPDYNPSNDLIEEPENRRGPLHFLRRAFNKESFVPPKFAYQPNADAFQKVQQKSFTEFTEIQNSELEQVPADENFYLLRWLYNGAQNTGLNVVYPRGNGVVSVRGEDGLITDYMPDQNTVYVRLDPNYRHEDAPALPTGFEEMMDGETVLRIVKSKDGHFKADPIGEEQYRNVMSGQGSNDDTPVIEKQNEPEEEAQTPSKASTPASNLGGPGS